MAARLEPDQDAASGTERAADRAGALGNSRAACVIARLVGDPKRQPGVAADPWSRDQVQETGCGDRLPATEQARASRVGHLLRAPGAPGARGWRSPERAGRLRERDPAANLPGAERVATVDLVERVAAGWIVTDKAKAITWWVDHYPGPGGLASHCYGLDPVVEQALRVHELLEARCGRSVARPGPWASPGTATLRAWARCSSSKTSATPPNPTRATRHRHGWTGCSGRTRSYEQARARRGVASAGIRIVGLCDSQFDTSWCARWCDT